MFVGVFFLVAAVVSAIERGGVVPSQSALLVAIAVLGIKMMVGIGLFSHHKVKQWSAFTIMSLFLLTSYRLLLQIRGKTQACSCLGQ